MKYSTFCVAASLACAFYVASGASLSVYGIEQREVSPHLVEDDYVSNSQCEYYVGFRVYNDWKDFKTCGGVRLNKNWILTTADCLDNIHYKNVRITAVVRPSQVGQVYSVLRKLNYTMNGKHDAKTKTNSITLLETNAFYGWSYTFSHPELPPKNYSLEPYYLRTGAVISYNITTQGPGNFDTITENFLTVRIILPQVCKEAYGSAYDENVEICTLLSDVGKGLNQGNVGSPLVFNYGGGTKLIGFVTKVRNLKATDDQLLVFTSIVPYIEWIEKHTKIPLKPSH